MSKNDIDQLNDPLIASMVNFGSGFFLRVLMATSPLRGKGASW
jgi:uncharacterized membrane protein YdcZ (DUF606 family)